MWIRAFAYGLRPRLISVRPVSGFTSPPTQLVPAPIVIPSGNPSSPPSPGRNTPCTVDGLWRSVEAITRTFHFGTAAAGSKRRVGLVYAPPVGSLSFADSSREL